MDDWKSKRAEWVKTRDNPPYKVGKGAVSGVSVGDAIDKVYESAKKGYTPLQKAVDKLDKDLETYAAKIRKMAKSGDKATEKYTKFADWVKNHLLKEVADLEANVKDDLKALDKVLEEKAKIKMLPFHVLDVDAVFVRLGLIRDARALQVAANKLKAEDATEAKIYEAAMKSENFIVHGTDIATGLAKLSQILKACKFKIQLPGKEAKYKELAKLGSDSEAAARLVVTCCKCKSMDDLFAAWKPTASLLADLREDVKDFDKIISSLRG